MESDKRGIKNVSEANHFLDLEYRRLFNDRFAVEPEGESIFAPFSADTDIDSILCVKHKRKTDLVGIFSFRNQCFQIIDRRFPIINARREIMVNVHPRYGIRVEYQGVSMTRSGT